MRYRFGVVAVGVALKTMVWPSGMNRAFMTGQRSNVSGWNSSTFAAGRLRLSATPAPTTTSATAAAAVKRRRTGSLRRSGMTSDGPVDCWSASSANATSLAD